MKKETVFHVFDKMTHGNHYFGSVVSIFKFFNDNQLRVTKGVLYRHDFANPYENELCKIIKGQVERSKQTTKSESDE